MAPWTYLYYEPGIQRNDKPPVVYNGSYTNDVVANEALDLIDQAVAADKPFVVVAAPVGPHSAGGIHDGDPGSHPPQPARRHEHLFQDVQVPRTDNFNPKTSSGGNWVARLPRQKQEQLDYNDEYYRQRLRTLQSIDEMVENIVQKLDAHGVLDNTYIIYSTDNGYHIGQHRLPPGKICGYEEDINVPFIIRGPGVPQGKTVGFSSSHVDLAPTILDMFGLSLDHPLDGSPIPYSTADIADAESSTTRSEHVQVEFWGIPSDDGPYDCK